MDALPRSHGQALRKAQRDLELPILEEPPQAHPKLALTDLPRLQETLRRTVATRATGALRRPQREQLAARIEALGFKLTLQVVALHLRVTAHDQARIHLGEVFPVLPATELQQPVVAQAVKHVGARIGGAERIEISLGHAG